MRTEPSRSLLNASEIKEYIYKKYNPTVYKERIYSQTQSIDIYIEVESEKKGFKVITPILLEEEDILSLFKEIINEKEIAIDSCFIKIEQNDGNASEKFEPVALEFVGVEFTWNPHN